MTYRKKQTSCIAIPKYFECRKLQRRRVKEGYTIEEMAEILQISNAEYRQIEAGKIDLAYGMAVAISRIFHLQPDTLFFCDAKFWQEKII